MSKPNERVVELFDVAADMGPSTQAAFLDRECGTDSGLREAVERLLESDRASEDGLLHKELPAAPILRPSVITLPPMKRHISQGSLIGNYRITEMIGQGGMGIVYAAQHEALDKRAVVKVLAPSCARDEQMCQRFIKEAEAAARIRHPGIVDVFDVGRHPPSGELFILMEYLDGEPLAQRLEREGILPPELALSFICQALHALAAVHERGIVHRDLKPDNLFVVADADVTYGERIKLLDFGIAKLLEQPDESRTQSGLIMGTPQYMAPEQCRGLPDIDHRADLYAIGVILFQMLAGRRPFECVHQQQYLHEHINIEPPPLERFNAAVWPEISAVVSRLMAKRPCDRFDSARALSDRLHQIVQDRYTADLEPTRPSRPLDAATPPPRHAMEIFPVADPTSLGHHRPSAPPGHASTELARAEISHRARPTDASLFVPVSAATLARLQRPFRESAVQFPAPNDAPFDAPFDDPLAEPLAVPGEEPGQEPGQEPGEPPIPTTRDTGFPRKQRSIPSLMFARAIKSSELVRRPSATNIETAVRPSDDTGSGSPARVATVSPRKWFVPIGSALSLLVGVCIVFVLLTVLQRGSTGTTSRPGTRDHTSAPATLTRLMRDWDVASEGSREDMIEAIRLVAPLAAAPILDRALERGQASVRGHAVRALCDLEWSDAANKIRRAMQGVGGHLRVHMAACLVELGDWQPVNILERALADDEPGLHIVAAYALAKLGQNDIAAPILRRALESQAGSLNWIRAHRGLLALGDPDARESLVRACAQPEPSVRVIAASILANQDDDEGVNTLLRMAHDPTFERRGEAALALARLGRRTGLGYVGEALRSEQASERRLAIAVAGRLADRGGREFADEIARLAEVDPSPDVRLMARVATLAFHHEP